MGFYIDITFPKGPWDPSILAKAVKTRHEELKRQETALYSQQASSPLNATAFNCWLQKYVSQERPGFWKPRALALLSSLKGIVYAVAKLIQSLYRYCIRSDLAKETFQKSKDQFFGSFLSMTAIFSPSYAKKRWENLVLVRKDNTIFHDYLKREEFFKALKAEFA